MKYICSDTNIWLDFNEIHKLDTPFLLPETFIMYEGSIQEELLYPEDLAEQLLEKGLLPTDITTEEFFFAEQILVSRPKLSRHDAIALAIAKHRNIPLVTGDRRLRAEAERQDVPCMGTIGILDRLSELELLTLHEQYACWKQLHAANGKVVRLPKQELESRIAKLEALLVGAS